LFEGDGPAPYLVCQRVTTIGEDVVKTFESLGAFDHNYTDEKLATRPEAVFFLRGTGTELQDIESGSSEAGDIVAEIESKSQELHAAMA
jgi:hypothetical protein